MLGARSVIGVVFKDIAPVLKIHKTLGKWGSTAFLLHPLLVIYSYGESVLYTLIPHVGTEFERAVTLGRIAFMIIIFVWVTSILLRGKLGFRPWKYIHYFAYISLPFALLHVPQIGSQFLAQPVVRGYYFAIVGLFALFTLIRLSGWLNLDRKKYTVLSHVQTTDEDYLMIVRPAGVSRLKPRLGQYVYLKVGLISEDHPFTVAYHYKENGELWLDYRVFGSYTRYLTTLAPGTVVSLAGSYGSFMSDLASEDTTPVVYLAGGIGVTPFAQRVLDESTVRPQLLFAANRTYRSAVLVPNIKAIMGERCIAVYSREIAVKPGDELGHIDERLLRKYIEAPDQYTYYLCGPQSFVHDLTEVLKNMGVKPQQILAEEFDW